VPVQVRPLVPLIKKRSSAFAEERFFYVIKFDL